MGLDWETISLNQYRYRLKFGLFRKGMDQNLIVFFFFKQINLGGNPRESHKGSVRGSPRENPGGNPRRNSRGNTNGNIIGNPECGSVS